VRAALDRLAADEGETIAEEAWQGVGEEAVERPLRLNDARLEAVTAALREAGASLVIDLGWRRGQAASAPAR
jgi:hypothetical protein